MHHKYRQRNCYFTETGIYANFFKCSLPVVKIQHSFRNMWKENLYGIVNFYDYMQDFNQFRNDENL